MSDRSHKGFTLVELLVVITIIGMLAALVVPAVIRSTDFARQTKCINYQRQLGLAVNGYTARKGHYPGYREPGGYNWVVAIFPDLDRKVLWEDWRDGNGAVVRLDQLVCPGDEDAQRDAPLSYVANTNIFVNRSAGREGVRPEDTERIPSTTTTVMLGESYSEGGSERKWTHTRENEVGFAPGGSIGELFPSSHAGGSVVTFCDSHAKFLPDTTAMDATGTIIIEGE